MGPGPADDDRDVELAVTSDDSSDDDDLDHAAGDADVAGSGSVVLSGQASPSARLLTDGQRQALGEALGAPGGEFIVQDSEGATRLYSNWPSGPVTVYRRPRGPRCQPAARAGAMPALQSPSSACPICAVLRAHATVTDGVPTLQ